MRVAMLTYSLKPRGGVVHALEVAEALARRGHEVELMALGRPGEELFRPPGVPLSVVRHEPPDLPFDLRVEAMLTAYADGLAERLPDGTFDVVHTQDCLSANAAVELRDLGLVEHVIRTVHHVDDFRSPSLVDCQRRSIVAPDRIFCVSRPWVEHLASEFGVEAGLVGNGVDSRRLRPPRDAGERAVDRRAAGLDDGRLVVLTVGGVEPRKGSLTLLEGFARLRSLAADLDPLLVIAGGATLLDYRDEIERFRDRATALGVEPEIRVLGSVTDAELERLYRAADLFALPSLKEGFGLVALEALAAELPLVASDLDVFRTFLADGDSALLTPVGDPEALALALADLARDPERRARLRAGGREVVRSHSWDAVASGHEAAYRSFLASPRRAEMAAAGGARRPVGV